MRLILAQTARTLASVVLLYTLLILASYAVAPSDGSPDIIDTSQSDKTIFSTAPKYLSFARARLASPEPKVLIVGASNADVGLRPDQMQPNISCAQVNNLSIGNENATEMRQTVDLIHFAQDGQARLNNTFVFGVWYGDFGDSIDRWPPSMRKDAETDIEVELYRYGFYKRGPDGPVAVLPAAWLPAEKILVRPFVVIESLVRRMTGRLRGYVFIRPPNKTEAEREAAHFSEEEQRDAALYWTNQLGRKDDVSSAQFAEFESMINRLLDAHEKVVLVDLPIPAWHQAATGYDAKYHKRLEGLVERLNGRDGFAFVDMLDLNADESYSDEVHPKPSLASIWGKRVSETVSSVACASNRQPSRVQAGKEGS